MDLGKGEPLDEVRKAGPRWFSTMTLIICPACNTRFETPAVIPPSGRKVRCSKCGNVWQATPAIEPAKPAAVSAPTPPPMQPRPAPAALRPAPAGLGTAMGRFPGAPAAPVLGPKPSNGPAPSVAPAPAAKSAPPMFNADDDMQPDPRGEGSFMGGAGTGALVEDLGSYNAGALVNPEEGLATNVPIAEGRKRKLPPAVAIGWGALALLLIMLAALLALAPKTVLSVLPGAARLYALMGKPANTGGLAIQNVHSAWSNADGQNMLQVTGEIANLTSSEVGVPTVVVALQDKTGKELSQATAKVLPIGVGAKSPFMVQIPSPPENVSSRKVRFAKAD